MARLDWDIFRFHTSIEGAQVRFFSLLFFFLVIINSGCATIIKGTTERVYISVSPASAKVELDGFDYIPKSRGVLVKRDRDHMIKVRAKGYEPQYTVIRSGFSASGLIVSILGNAVLGGLFGIVTDALTGSWYGFDPDEISIQLVPSRSIKPRDNEAFQDPACGRCGEVLPAQSRYCYKCGERSSGD